MKFKDRYKRTYSTYKILDSLADRMESHHIFLISAGIAFNIFLYLIPMFLMAVFVVNLLFDVNILAVELEKILLTLFPPTESAKDLIHTIINEIYIISDHSSVAGWIGIGILLWLSSTLFSSLRTGLNTIYRIETPRIFIVYRAKDIFLAIILAVLIMFSSYAVPLTSFITSMLTQNLPDSIEPYVSGLAILFFSLSSSFVFFYLLFRFVPNKRAPRFPRLISTGLSVVLIEISRNLFAWYLSSISNYGRFYGAYAVIVSMAIWIYYFTLIILVSAEIGNFIHDMREEKKENKPKPPESEENEELAEEKNQ